MPFHLSGIHGISVIFEVQETLNRFLVVGLVEIVTCCGLLEALILWVFLLGLSQKHCLRCKNPESARLQEENKAAIATVTPDAR